MLTTAPTLDALFELDPVLARAIGADPPPAQLEHSYLRAIEPLVAGSLARSKFRRLHRLAESWKAWADDDRLFGMLAVTGYLHNTQIFHNVYRDSFELKGKIDPFKGMQQHLLTLYERGLLWVADLYVPEERKHKPRLYGLTDAGMERARSLHPFSAMVLNGVRARPYTDEGGFRLQADLRLNAFCLRASSLEHRPVRSVRSSPLARRPLVNRPSRCGPGAPQLHGVDGRDYGPVVPDARLRVGPPGGPLTDLLVFHITDPDSPGTRTLLRSVNAFAADGYLNDPSFQHAGTIPAFMLIAEHVDHADLLVDVADTLFTGALSLADQPAHYHTYPARTRTLIADQHTLLYKTPVAQRVEPLPEDLRDALYIQEQYPNVELFPVPTDYLPT